MDTQNVTSYFSQNNTYTTNATLSSGINTIGLSVINQTISIMLNTSTPHAIWHNVSSQTSTVADAGGGRINVTHTTGLTQELTTVHQHARNVPLRTTISFTSPTTTLPVDVDRDFFLPWQEYWKIIAITCACLLLVCIVLLIYCMFRRRAYSKVAEPDACPPYDYVYKPTQGGYIEEEYENTFVGVSIPLLQEVTKV